MAKASFIAIGVGQGDAFFLEREGLAVLIDGGRSVQGFPAQFQKVTNRDSVDILVCTHNDADHANGILGFLRSGLTCKEVWLPGSWTDRLEDLLLHPESFTEELISNIEEIEVTPEKRLLLHALGDQYSERMMQQERTNEGAASTTDALSEALEKATTIEDYGGIFLYPPPLWPPKDWPYPWYRMWRLMRRDYERFRLFIEAISAATLIREISLAAYHAGALIRWFEYNTMSNDGGIQNVLLPLNSSEVFRIRIRRWPALMYLALTTSNKQSLVFLSPANDEEPAVLFTADSDLSFPQSIPWSNGMIVTAPHHGSEANANAYSRFTRDTSNNLDVIWVRSDGRFKTRPGKSYLSVRGGRFCTLCRGCNYPKQDVRLMVVSGKWEPVFTRECCCV
jgi:hypothetical protein